MTPGASGPFLLAATAALLAACAAPARLPPGADVGPSPTLPEPSTALIPSVAVAPAVGWPEGGAPRPATGLHVTALARGLDHPRWLYVLPNGDVLVAETNAPAKETKGVKDFFMKAFMKVAGAGVPSANRITLLRDTDGDGAADVRTAFLENLHSPFGMALVGERFYVANADAVVWFPYRAGETRIAAAPTKLTDLPGAPNHHWTKSLVANADGTKLYVGVGSNSNVAEHGLAVEAGRARVWEIDVATGAKRPFATGLRNPVGLAFAPGTGTLWAVVNERDELGSDLVPDYLTSVREGAFYGWPWSYWGAHVDARVEPANPQAVARAVRPDYALGNHVAPLGLAFSDGARLGERFAGGAFVGLHGSWNRRPPAGYRVVFVPFADGKPAGEPVEVLGGFVSPERKAWGRPVGVVIDRRGALLVADDVGNVVWRVAAR